MEDIAKTQGGEKTQSQRWMETMIKRHGSREAVSMWVQRIGSKGGRMGKGSIKGFAANPELARKAGAKGGKISKKGPTVDISLYAEQVELLYGEGFSILKIAKKLGLPYRRLLNWARDNLVGYGAFDDIEMCEKILEHENGKHE